MKQQYIGYDVSADLFYDASSKLSLVTESVSDIVFQPYGTSLVPALVKSKITTETVGIVISSTIAKNRNLSTGDELSSVPVYVVDSTEDFVQVIGEGLGVDKDVLERLKAGEITTPLKDEPEPEPEPSETQEEAQEETNDEVVQPTRTLKQDVELARQEMSDLVTEMSHSYDVKELVAKIGPFLAHTKEIFDKVEDFKPSNGDDERLKAIIAEKDNEIHRFSTALEQSRTSAERYRANNTSLNTEIQRLHEALSEAQSGISNIPKTTFPPKFSFVVVPFFGDQLSALVHLLKVSNNTLLIDLAGESLIDTIVRFASGGSRPSRWLLDNENIHTVINRFEPRKNQSVAGNLQLIAKPTRIWKMSDMPKVDWERVINDCNSLSSVDNVIFFLGYGLDETVINFLKSVDGNIMAYLEEGSLVAQRSYSKFYNLLNNDNLIKKTYIK